MNNLKNIFLLFLLLQIRFIAISQVSISPNFPIDGLFNIQQLYDVVVSNSSANTVDGYMVVSIELNGTEPVLKIASFPLKLGVGSVATGYDLKWSPNIEYGANDASVGLRRSGLLPMGRYIYCYSFFSLDNQILIKSCQELTISGFGPPELVFPYDREELTSIPILAWSPPVLSSPIEGIKYHLKLVKLDEHQNPRLGLVQNFPLMELHGLSETQIPFTSDFGRLKEGQKYVWQVDAMVNGFSLGKSNIWSFTVVKEKTALRAVENIVSYKLVRRRRDSKYCIADRILYFGYKNEYNEKELNYSITQIRNNRQVEIERIPFLKLEPGFNQLQISCKELGLKEKEMYLLTIYNEKGDSLYLEFKANP